MTKQQEAMMRRVFVAGGDGLHVPDPSAGERRTLNWLTNTGWLRREISCYWPTEDAKQYLHHRIMSKSEEK